MNKDTIEDIVHKLKQFEWRFNHVDNGPDEYRCPDNCSVPLIQNKPPPIFTHQDNCDFRKVLNILEKELYK